MSQYSYLMKICLFADKDVGKKSLARSNFVNSFCNGEGHMNTTGVEFAIKEVEIHGKVIKLQIWIISDDEERFQYIWNMYIRGSNGVILMYDITNAETLNRVSEWCLMIKNHRDDIPILLVGNKLDSEENREVSKEKVEKFKENNDISSSMEISVKTGEKIEKMFLNLTCMILKIDLKETLKKMLEEKRDYFIWIIDRAIKTKKEKFEGKRKLKKQQKLWRKNYFGETESFEDYIDKQKENLLNFAEYKNEIVNAKELPEMVKVWKKVKKLLNPYI